METILRTEDDSPKVCLPLTNTEGGITKRGVDRLEVSVWSDSFPDLIIDQSRDSSHFADGKFMETSLLRTEDDSPKVCLPLTNTEGSITKRGVDRLEVSVWSDSFSDLIIYQSRDSSHFADVKFMETSLLRTEDDSPKVCLPLTNTEGGKCRGAHGQDASVSSEHFSDLKNIQGWDLLFSADHMSMEPFTTHAEPKACLSDILTDGDIFERRGVDGPEVDGCSDRFLDLTIHQSQDSSLPEYSLSPKVCLSLTDIEVDIGVNELEVDICSDSFPDPIDIDSRDLSLTPGNRPMDVSHTVDDSPEETVRESESKHVRLWIRV
nr:uncharacterized protein LOC129420638 [Misgurnus anguillicaudatus]